MKSIKNEKNRESFLAYDSFSSNEFSNENEIYIVEPHKVSGIYLIDSIIKNRKNLLARETFYHSQIKTSFSEIIDHFSIENFYYVKKEKEKWGKISLKEKLKNEKVLILGPAYFERDHLAVEPEIVINAGISILLKARIQDCIAQPKAYKWNYMSRQLESASPHTASPENCLAVYKIDAASREQYLLFNGRVFIEWELVK